MFYLRRRLDIFAERHDVNLTPLNPMPVIAGKLTDQERFDLAAFFAAAAPVEKSASP